MSILLVTLGTGCRVVQTAADVPGQAVRAVTPGKKDKDTVDPVEVQQALFRFADEFSARMMVDLEKLRRDTNIVELAEVLQWKTALGTEIYSIASGPNAIANLLDMTVFVTLTRMAFEEHWQPRIFGESARYVLETCRRADTKIWQLAGTVLKSEQQAELHQAIETWRRHNLLPESVLGARALGFASELEEAYQASAAKSASVFSLLQIDPLSGLDPAVRELAQTRLLAERALYVTQKMPTLLRWQMELLSINAVKLPAVHQLVTNSTRIAASVDRFARVAEQLPGQVRVERQEILKALEAQENNLTPLVSEVRQALTAGNQMSTSLNMMLTTLDGVMQRSGSSERNRASLSRTNSEPFRIQDYRQTAAQLEATARQLTDLLLTLDQTLGSTNLSQLAAQVSPAVQLAQVGGREIVDYAFWKGILFLTALLMAALIYRFSAARLAAANMKSPAAKVSPL